MAKKQEKEKINGRPVGTKSKVGIQETWVKLFEENESRKSKLTDEQITERLHAEFPGWETTTFSQVQANRNKYNKGGFNKGVPPKIQSKSYDTKGNVLEVKRGRKATESPKAPAAKAKAKVAAVKVKAKVKVKKA